MTPERWQQVKAVMQAALDRPRDERAAFLREACGGDDALRAEVASLLAADETSEGFLEGSAIADAGLVTSRGTLDEAPRAGGDAGLLARLVDALGDRYAFARELGGGGMSRVFLAEERALGREVVVKVLSPGLAHTISAERFAREVRLAARLQQANIVPVLTAGEAAGLPYYTMPWVRGESLRARLAGGAPLRAPEALGLLRDVAKALAHAHAEGVVHRDIKPENILLSGGTAVVTDFGIARAVSAARAPQDGTLTGVGLAIGTPAYMAPEQAAGDERVDGRVDVYALGMVAWELLAGRHPFAHHRTPRALLVAQLTEEPPSLGALHPGLPPRLVEVVARCLAKEALARYASGGELLAALEDVEVASGERAAAVTGALPVAEPAIAVLPLANLSTSPDDEYFSDGITDEVRGALTRMRGLRVAARTSSVAFKGTSHDLRTIGERLGVAWVLEGSVRRAGSRVRIAVQLVDAADGLHLWSERYDRELTDIFTVQDEIAHAIAAALQDALAGATGSRAAPAIVRAQPAASRPVDPEAFELYLRGRHLLEQRAGGMRDALECFERAARLDPEFGAPHSGTGLAFTMFGLYHALPPCEAFPQARAAAGRAFALDGQDAMALLVRAQVALWHEWEIERAERLAQRALHYAPGLYLAHDSLGWTLAAAGRFDEAIAAMERARGLDPLSDYATADLGWVRILAGDFGRAIEELRPAVARHPQSSEIRRVLGWALFHAGRRDEAVAELREVLALDPANRWGPSNLAQALAATGATAEARALMATIAARMESEPLPAVGMAMASVGLGDEAGARRWLAQAIERCDYWLVMLRHDPSMAGVRAAPWFVEAMARVAPRDVSAPP